MRCSSLRSDVVGACAVAVLLAACGLSSGLPSGSQRFASASVGYGHVCALTSGGTVLCWGDNRWGQVSTEPGGLVLTPVTAIPLPMKATEISAGGKVSCAIVASADIYCWGDSLAGLRRIASSHDVLELRAGDPTCAITATHGVRCWAVLGGTPTDVASGPLRQLGVGRIISCALQGDSTAVCWPSDLAAAPVPVPGGFKFVSLSVGGAHACGTDVAGTVRCWGSNNVGQLGDATLVPRDTPIVVHVAVGSGDTMKRVFAGDVHTCALAADSSAYCWGARDGGRDGLGDADTGTSAFNFAPFAVHSAIHWDTLLTGGLMTCGYSRQVLYCWGGNTYGADGAMAGAPNAVPVAVDGQGP